MGHKPKLKHRDKDIESGRDDHLHEHDHGAGHGSVRIDDKKKDVDRHPGHSTRARGH